MSFKRETSSPCSPLPHHGALHSEGGVKVELPSKLQNQGPVNHASRLFALIVGIDSYVHTRELSGAVADANAMKDYLIGFLSVPEDRVRLLVNHQATREAIIKALKEIQDEERIRNKDPIVIFFAGHGAVLPAPRAWHIKGDIQWVVPQDYKPNSTHPIPDRTIGFLIEEIARKKGDNICVIFDCCYSAGAARENDDGDEYDPRTVDLDFDIPEHLDSDLWDGRAGGVPDSFAFHGLRSHVLLAACGEKELAYEHRGRGQFTSELLETLRSCAVDSLTYAEVLEGIHLQKQNPHCVGLNQHRILFDVRVPAGRQVRYAVRAESGGKHVIGAGLAHGISHGAQFTLYNDQKRSLGVVVVDEAATIDDFWTTVVTTSVDLARVSFAKLSRVGKVPLYLAPGGNLPATEAVRKMEVGDGSNVSNFWLVDKDQGAKLKLVMVDDNLVDFVILDQQVTKFGLTKLLRATALDAVTHVFSAAAHYYCYLDLANTCNHLGIDNGVSIDFHLLERQTDEFGLPILVPAKREPYQKDPLMGGSSFVDIVVDPDALYGVEIKNNTQRDLYLNALLFNNTSLSIVACYIQSCANNPEAPLKQKGTFFIGYGTEGTPPLGFSLGEGQDVDIAFLKIFFSTRPIDLTDAVQMSPFMNKEPNTDTGDREGGPIQETDDIQDVWFTAIIPIVQRRRR